MGGIVLEYLAAIAIVLEDLSELAVNICFVSCFIIGSEYVNESSFLSVDFNFAGTEIYLAAES